MPISVAETVTFTCPACSATVEATSWLIVAIDERPDLVALIRAGTLHTVTCVACGHVMAFDAPLLLYRAAAMPPILFSPAQQTSHAEDQQHAVQLIALLRAQLGDAWQPAWETENMPSVSRVILAAALADDPVAALHELQAQMQAQLEALRERDPAAYAQVEAQTRQTAATARLQQALENFLATDTWPASYQEIQAHPELLGDTALALLDELIVDARQHNQADDLAFYCARHDLLRRCQEIGTDAAFAEKLDVTVAEFQSWIAAGLLNLEVPADLAPWLDEAQQAMQAFLQQGDGTALTRAIEGWEKILGHPEFGTAQHALQSIMLNDAGGAFFQRYGSRGSIADLDRALALWAEALALAPPDAPNRPMCLNNLGLALHARYAHTGQLEDLEQAIAALEQAVAATPPGVPDHALYLTNLGARLRERYAHLGQLEDLEQALDALEQAEATMPLDAPDRPTTLMIFGLALRARYAYTGRLEDLEQAITAWEQAVAATPPDTPTRPTHLTNLGAGLCERYIRAGRLEDLEQAITILEQAVALAPPDAPDRPTYLNNLGVGLRTRYIRAGRLEDLEQAIAVWERAVALTAPDAPDRPMFLNNLGFGLRTRYAYTGRLEDLEQAIAALEQAVALASPDAPDRPLYLSNLGLALRDRYHGAGRLEDLEQAIAALEQALALASPNAPDRPVYLTNFGLALRARYDRTAWLEDLERAITAWEQAEAMASPDSPDRPMYLTNLGTGLRERYVQTGQLEDLEQALAVWEQAVGLAPPDAPDRPLYLSNLGTALIDRYERTGRLADLEQALAVWEQVVALSPPDATDRPQHLTNLGNGLRTRYIHTRQLADLDQAITVWEQAVALALPDAPARPMYLGSLGLGLSDRYSRTERLEDLEQAIAVLKQAVATARPDAFNRPLYLSNLGTGLHARYGHTGRLEDLEQAIAAYRQAVATARPDALDRPMYLNNLGNGLRDRYTHTRCQEDLEQARSCYADACKRGALLAPVVVLAASRSWGTWASARGAWTEATDAFALGVAIIEDLHRAQLWRGDQETWLSGARGLHTQAAYALARAAQPGDLQRAVEVVETGRARGIGDVLARNRSDLSQLEPDHPHIAARYRVAAERVQLLTHSEQMGYRDSLSSTRQPAHRDLIAEILAAHAELDAAITEIRGIPGHGRFLLPPTYAEIAAVTRPGLPLIYLIITPAGSLALIVAHSSAEPEALFLDGFAAHDLTALLIKEDDGEVVGGYLPAQWLGSEQLRAELRAALPRLGEALIAPLAVRLRALGAHGVTLIPTGQISLLPLHAAPYIVADAPRCLLDEFDVAFAPSARVLATAQRERQRRTTQTIRFVGVGNPLPGAATISSVHGELQQVLPLLRQQVQALLPLLNVPVQLAGPELHGVFTEITRDWRASLERLAWLAQQPTEQLIQAGAELARAATLFGALLEDVGPALHQLAARIPPRLTYARAELQSILDLLPPGTGTALIGAAATCAALWAALPQATLLHFACHGQFALEDPHDSALLLADATRLTLRELIGGDPRALAQVRLVVLSACQTALTDFRRVPDEGMGLPGGFLQAGVPAVVGTLWAVDDLSTALLMHRFYAFYLHGDPAQGLAPQPPARALQLAQRWLRDLTCAELFTYVEHQYARSTASPSPAGGRMAPELIREALERAEEAADPNDRLYTDPVFWAAFTFAGAMEEMTDGP